MEPFIAYISDWLFHPALFSQFSNFCLPSSSPSLSCHFSDLPLHLLPQICNFLSFCSHISGFLKRRNFQGESFHIPDIRGKNSANLFAVYPA
ncbi:hypothetical protein E1A91_D06G072200v1 [Gossypium mustelinum]|uniref:Uncharacterized protein n=1 Tax=Gossypium mustelinum TaxID=34275 RepID=A0A5D2UFG3_GOSMU|nr:hypothetical protein E1A91_D06G072200v1 [Gossypium mustelinum]